MTPSAPGAVFPEPVHALAASAQPTWVDHGMLRVGSFGSGGHGSGRSLPPANRSSTLERSVRSFSAGSTIVRPSSSSGGAAKVSDILCQPAMVKIALSVLALATLSSQYALLALRIVASKALRASVVSFGGASCSHRLAALHSSFHQAVDCPRSYTRCPAACMAELSKSCILAAQTSRAVVLAACVGKMGAKKWTNW